MSKPSPFFVISLILLFSCSKKVVTYQTKEIPQKLKIEEIDFEYFHGKARMVLKDGNKEREVKANIRVRKDSIIWMNFTVIGVQGGRILINQDSITIVSNVDKEYYVFDYAELSSRFNFEVNYRVIQSAFLGNPIIEYNETDELDQKSATLLLHQTSGNVDVLNYISAETMKIQKVELRENNTHNTLTINYSNFQPVGGKLFPYNGTITLLYKSGNRLLNTTIIFEYDKAEVGDKELKFPFNIPKKYDRR
jgi:outer membrane lipoprotein-sorting protein